MKTKNKNGDQQFLEIKNEKAKQKMFSKNRFRKCLTKIKKWKQKTKWRPKLLQCTKSWTTPRQKSGCTKMFPRLCQNWNCKTGNVARENGGMQNVPEQNAGGDKKWQKCKNGKNGKTGSGGGVPVPYQRLINCKKGHFWNFGHFSRAWVPRRAAQELYLSIKIHRNREVGPRTTFDQKSDNFRNRVFCIFFQNFAFFVIFVLPIFWSKFKIRIRNGC